jgi:hypothetical protein
VEPATASTTTTLHHLKRCFALIKVKDLLLVRLATFSASWVQEQVPASTPPIPCPPVEVGTTSLNRVTGREHSESVTKKLLLTTVITTIVVPFAGRETTSCAQNVARPSLVSEGVPVRRL